MHSKEHSSLSEQYRKHLYHPNHFTSQPPSYQSYTKIAHTNSLFSLRAGVLRGGWCSSNQGPVLLNYPLLFQANFLGFSPTFPTTGFPAFVGISLQFVQVQIMATTATLHKDPNCIQDSYLWLPITDVTPCIFVILIPLRHPSNFALDSYPCYRFFCLCKRQV